MSFGITAGDEYYQIEKLRILCEKIEMKGTIIVSAFDNDGAISYPAFLTKLLVWIPLIKLINEQNLSMFIILV